MRHDRCCVIDCKNTGRNNKTVKFYKFPTSKFKVLQRSKWIAAVRRLNEDGSAWLPKTSDTICSAHFVNNRKADEQTSPSYVPSIFPSLYKTKVIDDKAVSSRHERFLERNLKPLKEKQVFTKTEMQITNRNCLVDNHPDALHIMAVNRHVESNDTCKPVQIEKLCSNKKCEAIVETNIDSNLVNNYAEVNENMEVDNPFETNNADEYLQEKKLTSDQACEVFFVVESYQPSKTFVCNRYICKENSSITCEVEIQTDIIDAPGPLKISNRRKWRDAACNTVQSGAMVDKSVGPDFTSEEVTHKNFCGFDSVHKDEDLIAMAGVTFENFNFLLEKLDRSEAENCKITHENRLFILLMKLKTGLTFSAMAVIFSVHRTTISIIFYDAVQCLARATRDYVFWPAKVDVLKTMPECFREEYNNTRVIIDCTEFRVETPPRVDDRVFLYSHYKKSFTAKLLVGITPSGFISFKSKVAGGRKSDSQITIESGLIDLLEDGDIVLADKGFPQFQTKIDEKGSNVLLVMPPFLDKNKEFTKEETEETYRVAKCRIHVERIMQRIRTFMILNKITHNLFKHIDDIVHVICVLVNLQPPIIKQEQ